MKKIKVFFTNKYLLTLLLCAVWMLFFDSNSLFRQYENYSQKKQLQHAVNEKRREIEMIKRSLNMLKETKSLERFAREEYRFKKENEEIFVIVEAK